MTRNTFHRIAVFLILNLVCLKSSAQLSLGFSPYTQDFNNLNGGLPTGWTVRTAASNIALGTTTTFNVGSTPWSTQTGGYYNCASAWSPATSLDNNTVQAANTNRALAVRQNSAGSLDPGAAIVLQLANTSSLYNFSLSFKLMELDPTGVSGRTTTWNVDYGFGSSPTSFTNATTSPSVITTTLGSGWGTTNVTVNFGSALNAQSGNVWIRVCAKSTSSGSGSRPMTAIDDVSLSYDNISIVGISPIYAGYCGGSPITVEYKVSQPFTIGNSFTVQLSDAAGSFSSPTNIGSVSGIASGTINAVFPPGVTPGTGYRIRVVSSNPVHISASNGYNITLVAPPTVSISGCNQLFTASTPLTAVKSGGGPDSVYQWYNGVTPVGTNSSGYTATSAGNYSVYFTDQYGCTATSSVHTLASSSAPLNGDYNIPDAVCGFSTLAAALNKLNTNGVSGPVTFNIAGGYTETGPVGGLTINLCGLSASLKTTETNTLTIKKSGAGAKPLLTAHVGTSTNADGILRIIGTDYVTIDSIDFQDSYSNTTGNPVMEWGIAFLKCNGNDGANHNTVKNCHISLRNSVTTCRGIYSANHSTNPLINATYTGPSTATAVDSSRNGHNTFLSNVIDSAYLPIFISGNSSTSGSFLLGDTLNVIGNSGQGNNLSVFGGGAFNAVGIWCEYQHDFVIGGNTIFGGHGSTNFTYGIRITNGFKCDVGYNTMELHAATLAILPIQCGMDNGTSTYPQSVSIHDNYIQNCSWSSSPSSSFNAIANSAAGTGSVNISNNHILNNNFTTGNITFTGIINSNNIASLTISGNDINGNSCSNSPFIGINVTGSPVTLDVISNSINNNTATSTFTGIICNASGPGTRTISRNSFQTNIYNSTATFTGISNTGTPALLSVNANLFDLNLKNGIGTMTLINYGAPTVAVVDTNIFSNNTINGAAGGTCTFTGISGSAPNITIRQNTFVNDGIIAMAGANPATVTGILHSAGTITSETVENNYIRTLYATGGSAVYTIRGINVAGSGSSTRSISSNTIDSLYTPTGSNANITAITTAAANNVIIAKNKITRLQPGGQSGITKGIFINGGNYISVYNNLVGLDYASPPLGLTGTSALVGVDVSAGAVVSLYYNTIRLSGSSTGANFGTNGINLNSVNPLADIRNNIVVNLSTPSGTGVACALRRTSTVLNGYATTSNRNIYYSGTPSATHPIYYDLTNAYQTLAAFQSAVSPRENFSKTESVPFFSIDPTSPDYLKLGDATPTFAESGARPISSTPITDDYFGNLRNSTTPDIGAHEENFTNAGVIITNVTADPPSGQCLAVSHDVTATIIEGLLPGVIANLHYSFDGIPGAGSPVAMVNYSGNEWIGTIPAASPANAPVTWYVSVSDLTLSDNQNLDGTGYQDAYLPSLSLSVNPSAFCPSSPITISAKVPPPAVPGAATYCSSYHTSGCFGDHMSQVVLNTLNVNAGSACGSSEHYTYFNGGGAQTTTLTANNGYSLNVTFGSDINQYFGAWIDYDHDGSYGSSEFLGASGNAGANGTTGVSFNVPLTAYDGITHLRIVGGNDVAVTSSQACGISSSPFGETMDFNLTITGGVSSVFPSELYLYSWSAGAGEIASTNPAVVVSPAQGSATYTITITDINGCTASDQVGASGNFGNILLTSTDTIICGGDSITLTAQTDFPAGTYSWSSTGGLANPSETNLLPQLSLLPASNTSNTYTYTYLVSIVNTQTNCAIQETIDILVHPQLIASAEELNPDECIHWQNEIEVTASGGTMPYLGTGNFFVDGGLHIYTVTDAVGCQSIDSVETIGELFFDLPDTIIVCIGDPADISLSQYIVGGFPPFSIWGDTTGLIDDDYVFSVHDSQGCGVFSNTHVSITNCIIPSVEPSDSGKTASLIGSDLQQIYDDPSLIADSTNTHYVTNAEGEILIEVVSNVGYYDSLLTLLQTPAYGMSDFFSNGDTTLIITGMYPIMNLLLLNDLPTLINTVRPYNPPINNSAAAGIAYSQGDSAIHGGNARAIFGVEGEGVKVGVISDSYNTQSGDYAQVDVFNGDLPGVGNPYNTTPVQVVKEYPYGIRSDEGRAMLQIVHDVAPKAQLAFRTGFISQGDFADGIHELQQLGCNEIIDDVTFINEPFFKDGIISQAVDYVKGQGVSYFTSAGNFGARSYESIFTPVNAPPEFTGKAHDFGGGDVMQNVSLLPGLYTIVLQWEDSIYSLGQLPGALNDYDIFLLDNTGNKLFGFNRVNTGEDPVEILQFIVRAGTTANIMVTRDDNSDNVRFKYVAFRGELTINEHNSGASTVVGQANAAGAMAVGAVLYSKTPAYGADPATIASFSSVGGTMVEGTVRNKPDFVAPNGVNTTVNLGHVNIEGDNLPNFFGTSCAAPHAGGAAALLISAKKKFYNSSGMSPDSVKLLLRTTTLEMGSPGFDYINGYGFVQADSALQKIASPKPLITQLVSDPSKIPGAVPFTATVNGNYFRPGSLVYLGGVALPTTYVNSRKLTAAVPVFAGNPAVQAYNPPMTAGELDGGFSNPKYFLRSTRKVITITADEKTKRYGETIPSLTATVLVDGVPYQSTSYTLASLGLSAMQITTPATTASSFGLYLIRPSIAPLNPTVPADSALLAQFEYFFNDGILRINKLPLLITARDTSVEYGKKIRNLHFNYVYDDAQIPVGERAAFYNNLVATHASAIDTNVVLIDDDILVNGRSVAGVDLYQLAFVISKRAIANGRSVAGRSIINGAFTDHTLVVDVSPECLFNYQLDSAVAPLVDGRAIVSGRSVAGRNAEVSAVKIINEPSYLNGYTANDSTRNNVVVVVDAADVEAAAGDLIEFKSINMVSGMDAGTHYIVPAALLSGNFDISYNTGTITITPATLFLEADDQSYYFDAPVPLTSRLYNYQYSDTDSVITGAVTFTILDNATPVTPPLAVGTYTLVPDASLVPPSNYVLSVVNGTLDVLPRFVVNIKMYIEGFYSGNGLMDNYGSGGNLYLLGTPGAAYEDADTVSVGLMESFPPYDEAESREGILQTNGDLSVSFGQGVTEGENYYLRVKHRNIVETWSKNPVMLDPVTSYDFTTASTQAFDDGFNIPMKLMDTSPDRWAFYSGDVDQDGGVSSLDMTMEENDSNGGAFGYNVTDLNGDGASDALDMTLIENNGNVGVFMARP